MVGKLKKSRVEQTKDTVYLYQAPRSEWAPSLSPECLKVETWLKMNQIPYEHIDYHTMTVAANSQLPFCKINSKEISYSNQMINEIATTVGKEATTPTGDDGIQTAFEGLIEGRLHWVLIYIRATQANQLPPSDIFQGRWSQFLRPLAYKVVANKLKTKADYQGIGRQNVADVIATGKKDLRAISSYLGEKNYLAGDKPGDLDATAFAHLSQFWYIPIDNELKSFIKEECPNLVAYLDRIKQEFWQDWEDKCRKPPPPRRTKSKEEPAVAEKQENGGSEKSAEPTPENGCAEKESETKPIESTVEIVAEIPEEPKTAAVVVATINGEKTE